MLYLVLVQPDLVCISGLHSIKRMVRHLESTQRRTAKLIAGLQGMPCDINLMSVFSNTQHGRSTCTSWFFQYVWLGGWFLFCIFNATAQDNNCTQVSLFESCKYILQCTAANLQRVSVPLARLTALTSFFMISCNYCLNNYGTLKIGI